MSVERVVLKSGKVVHRVRWRDGAGRNRSKVIGRKRDAEAFDAELKRMRRLGDIGIVDAGRETVADFGLEWFAVYCQPKLAPKTLRVYADFWDRLVLPHLGQHRLVDLNPQVIARWQADLKRAGFGDPSILKAARTLHTALERAVEWRRISANPCRAVRKPGQRRSRPVRPLAPTTVEQLRGVMRPRDATLVSVLAYAGLRPGEALALTWGDVRDRTILVARSAGEGGVRPTKTGRSRTVRLLAPLRQDLGAFRLAQGRPGETGVIFPDRYGQPWTPGRWTGWWNTWRAAIDKVGLEGVRPYDLRHSFVSLLISEGQSILEVARQAGHSPTMALEVYGHLFDEVDPAQRVPAEERIRAAREAGTHPVPLTADAGPAFQGKVSS